MAKPRTPNQKKRYSALNKRLAKYVSLVRSIYDQLGLEAANIVITGTNYNGKKPFRFKDYPAIKSRVNELMRYFSHDLQAIIYSGTTKEWKQSNLVQDLVANDVLKVYGMRRDGERIKRYYQPNNEALKAFQRRKDKGMTVSQKIWNQSYNFKRELEYAISSGIEKGQSAITLSKRISKYLNDFPSLQTDYKERYGKATECKDCEYRSIRLARSEINMAYREAEQIRWQQMDFIKGYEIKLSHSHPKHDVCDELAGIYPKWFKWTGWHPNCYSEDTEVLTDKGWKLFKDVEIDDLVLSLNPTTRNVEWVEIIDMQCYEHNGEMVRFFNKSLDCLVTPDHQMVYVNKSNGALKTCAASEYRRGKGGFYRGCEYEAKEIKSITIADREYDFDVFCEFMAYYLSDGSLQRNSGICIAQKDGQPYKEDIANCIRRMGYEPKNYGDTLFIFDCKLNAYLKQFGKAHDKFIPTEIKKASKRQIKLFLDAYSKCDGYTRLRTENRFKGNHGKNFAQKNEERMYFSISNMMVRDLSELILKVGHRPSFRKNDPNTTHTSKGREIKANYPCWVINECYSTTATVFEKETIPYDGYVYDLTLERNHIMYIRRNGKCFWGSNCMCYVIPIVMTDDEWYSGKGMEITDTPDNFKEWIGNNQERIAGASERGTLPYWISDNKAHVMEKLYEYNVEHNDTNDTYEDIANKVKEILKPKDGKFYVSFDPFSPVVMEKLNSLRDAKKRKSLFNEILNDERAEEIVSSDTAKTVMYPNHKGKGKSSWEAVKRASQHLNDNGRNVILLPEYEGTTHEEISADALVMFRGKPVIADFKCPNKYNWNSLQNGLEYGFEQAGTIVLYFDDIKVDIGLLKDALEYLRRNDKLIGNLMYVSEYGKVLELSDKEIRYGSYKKKLKGFL